MDTDDRRLNGPYDTDADARAGAAPLLAALAKAGADGKKTAASGYLTGVLGRSGVELGAYDTRIAEWLATQEPETQAVVVGWVHRAHADGCAEAEVNLAPKAQKSTGSAPARLEAEFPDTEA
jgi:hypothetical protein